MEKILEFFKVAELLLPAFITAYQRELKARKGIHLAILPTNNQGIENITSKMIGEIPPDKQEEKKKFAHEKITRLKQRAEGGHQDLTTFDTEDVEKQQFGGGISLYNYYISGSGFPPHLDQEFVVMLSLLCGELSHDHASMIYLTTEKLTAKWK